MYVHISAYLLLAAISKIFINKSNYPNRNNKNKNIQNLTTFFMFQLNEWKKNLYKNVSFQLKK